MGVPNNSLNIHLLLDTSFLCSYRECLLVSNRTYSALVFTTLQLERKSPTLASVAYVFSLPNMDELRELHYFSLDWDWYVDSLLGLHITNFYLGMECLVFGIDRR